MTSGVADIYTDIVTVDAEKDDQEKASEEIKLYKKRFFMISLFLTLSVTNAAQWLQFSIISNITHKHYSVPETSIAWTSMIYMLCYIVLVIPATWVLDRFGLRVALIAGAVGNCLGAWIKCFAAAPTLFWVAFLGQTVAGASQIFVLGIPPKLAAVWFGYNEVATATGVAVFGNQLGVALGFIVPPLLVSNNDDPTVVERQLRTMFLTYAASTTVVLLLIVVFFRQKPPTPSSIAQVNRQSETFHFKSATLVLLGNIHFDMLAITYGINLGVFYAISTLLNQTIVFYFPGHEKDAGVIGLLIVLLGSLGSLLTGIWLDRTGNFQCTNRTVYTLCLVGIVAYTFLYDLASIEIIFFICGFFGFFMTAYLMLGFEVAAEMTYPISEGISAAILNVSGQVFGIMATVGCGKFMELLGVKEANIFLSALLLLATIATFVIHVDKKRHGATLLLRDVPSVLSFTPEPEDGVEGTGNNVGLLPVDHEYTCPTNVTSKESGYKLLKDDLVPNVDDSESNCNLQREEGP